MIDNYNEIEYIKKYIQTGEFINYRFWRRDAGLFVRWMKSQGFSKSQVKQKLVRTCNKMHWFNYDVEYELINNIIEQNWKKEKPFITVEKIEVPKDVIYWFAHQNLKKNELKLLFTLYIWTRIQAIYYDNKKANRIYWFNDKIFLKKSSNIVNSVSIMNTMFNFEEKGYITEFEGSAILKIQEEDAFHTSEIGISKLAHDNGMSVVSSSVFENLKFKDKLILNTDDLYNIGNWIWDVLTTKKNICLKCGRPIESKQAKVYCDICSKLSKYTPQETKLVKCIDCGTEFEVSSKSHLKEYRCQSCYEIHRTKKNREKSLRYYNKNKEKYMTLPAQMEK